MSERPNGTPLSNPYAWGQYLADLERLVGQYREALKLAYPYVKEALDPADHEAVQQIVRDDLLVISGLLALSETPPAARSKLNPGDAPVAPRGKDAIGG